MPVKAYTGPGGTGARSIALGMPQVELRGQSFQAQREFGMKMLKDFGAIP